MKTKQRLKKWIGASLAIPFFFLLIAGGTLLFLLEFPSAWIRPSTLSYVANQLQKPSFRLGWKHCQLRFEKIGFLSHRLFFQFEDFTTKTETLQLDLTSVKGDLQFHFLKGLERITDLGIQAKKISAISTPEQQEKQTESSSLPSWITRGEIEKLSGNVDHFEYGAGKEKWTGEAKLEANLGQADFQGSLFQEPKTKLSIKAKATQIQPKVLRIQDLLEARFQARLEAQSSFEGKKAQIESSLQGQFEVSRMDFNLKSKVHLQQKWIQDVRVDHCHLKHQRTQDGGFLTLDCPVTVSLNPHRAHRDIKDKLSREIQFKLATHLASSQYPATSTSLLKGQLGLSSLAFHHPKVGVQIRGKVEADIQGIPANFPKGWKFDSNVQTAIQIQKFDKLVSMMEGTSFAIPAPFRSLTGAALLDIRGKASLDKFEFPYTLKTTLGSPDQKMHAEGDGILRWNIQPNGEIFSHLGLNLLLSDIQIVLPKIDLGGMPQLLPDSRIKKTKDFQKKTPEESHFSYHVQVRTEENHPVRLLSNFSKSPIPLYVSLDMTPSQIMEGVIEIKSFPINLFRRPARLKRLNLHVKSPIKHSEIDGVVDFDYSDYKVRLKLTQTLEKPHIRVDSNPYLPENQVFATLLFGHPIEELDPEQASSAGDTRAAVENGAMDLLSLYVLASTPVQSVHYDPNTQTLSAVVRLEDGASLNVGADPNNVKTLGFRKRLGKHWVIQTDLNNPVDSDNRNLSTFIEWNYRH